jgi:hypothetical protein
MFRGKHTRISVSSRYLIWKTAPICILELLANLLKEELILGNQNMLLSLIARNHSAVPTRMRTTILLDPRQQS